MARATVSKAPVHLWLTAPIIALVLFFAPIPAWAVEEYYSRVPVAGFHPRWPGVVSRCGDVAR
jgi:hypothetical protein